MNRHDSYTELLRRHRRRVWRMCWLYAGGDFERCRDLVQEVSLALWEHYGKLRPDAHPMEERAWVTWQTRTVLNHLHRGLSHHYEPLTPAVTERLEVEPEHANARAVTEDLLASLPEDDREVVRLRLEGYSAAEIAAELGLKRDAVYQRLHRIVDKLRDKYGYER